MPSLPFLIRRPLLLGRDLLTDRDNPDLDALSRIDDPERFVWTILPHAARTFSACIALLPKRAAKAAAVGYLYCRMLDTYEDLVVDAGERERALQRFADRLKTSPPLPAQAIHENQGRDRRDASHLLLVERHELVDRMFCRLDPAMQELIRVLVRDMSAGMRWSSATFEAQGGVLHDPRQLVRYCRGVLGHPVVFASRLLHWHQSGDSVLPSGIEEKAMMVGEMIQLANVTRDIEKDLRRGIAYHPALRGDLAEAASEDPERAERIRKVREELLVMALERAPAYRPVIDYLSPHRFSLARASGVLMLSFTDRYFRSCARKAGRPTWGDDVSATRLILAALPAVWSRRWARRQIAGIERDFLQAAAHAC